MATVIASPRAALERRNPKHKFHPSRLALAGQSALVHASYLGSARTKALTPLSASEPSIKSGKLLRRQLAGFYAAVDKIARRCRIFLEQMGQLEDSKDLRKRKRKPADRKALEVSANMLCANLVQFWNRDTKGTFGVLKSPTWYAKNRHRLRSEITSKGVTGFLDFLVRQNHVELVSEGKKHPDAKQGLPTQIRAKKGFISFLTQGDISPFDFQYRRSPIDLKSNDKTKWYEGYPSLTRLVTMIKRESIASAVTKLDEFIRSGRTGFDNVIPGTTLRLEREFREERSPGILTIFDGEQRIAWVTIEDDGRLIGGGEGMEIIIEAAAKI